MNSHAKVFFEFVCYAAPAKMSLGRLLSASRCFQAEAVFFSLDDPSSALELFGDGREPYGSFTVFLSFSPRYQNNTRLRGVVSGKNPLLFPKVEFEMSLDEEANLWKISGRGSSQGVASLQSELCSLCHSSTFGS